MSKRTYTHAALGLLVAAAVAVDEKAGEREPGGGNRRVHFGL